jgi:hypothetical protein
MGFLDKFKGNSELKDKVADLARENDDKVDDAIDKVADLADDASKGKYSDQIDSAAEKAKDATPGEQSPS